MIHFINLTRGLYCPHLGGTGPEREHYCRIQSTHCEQKNWPGVVHGAGPDLLILAAAGADITVHDCSENDHETRAMWQGLAFVRRACETLWGAPLTSINGRGGYPMQLYFDGEVVKLPDPVIAYVRYYRKWYSGGPVTMRSCWGVS